MALMERIVRPHVPVDTGPSKQLSKCYEPPKNNVQKFDAPAGMTNYNPLGSAAVGGGFNTKDPPQVPDQQEKTKNSSWSYAYKRYMTKVEKEKDKCEEDQPQPETRIVGGQATDKETKVPDKGPGQAPGSSGQPPASNP